VLSIIARVCAGADFRKLQNVEQRPHATHCLANAWRGVYVLYTCIYTGCSQSYAVLFQRSGWLHELLMLVTFT